MAAETEQKAIRKRVLLTQEVSITINDPDVIERVTGPKGDEWRAQLYNLHTEEDVLAHLAYNALVNGCENAALLDGWADLPADAVSMEVIDGVELLTAFDEPPSPSSSSSKEAS